MASIGEMYSHVQKHAEVPPMGKILFYSGSPTANILVISEAPTREMPHGGRTFYASTVHRHQEGEWDTDEITAFWQAYPFTDDLAEFGFHSEKRHPLYMVYVDQILDFVENKPETIAFTDVYKEPLDGDDLSTALADDAVDYGTILKTQLDYVRPEVIVCNKKNVSSTVTQLLGVTDPGDQEPNVSTQLKVSFPSWETTVVFSGMAHGYMDLFSRQRLSREIKAVYNRRSG